MAATRKQFLKAAAAAHLHGFDYHLGFDDWLMYLRPKTQLYANDIASHPHGPNFFKTVLDHGSGFPELPCLWAKGSPWAGKVTHNDNVASDLEPEDHIDSFVALRRESGRDVSGSRSSAGSRGRSLEAASPRRFWIS